jgi:hypothetical protein
MKPTLIYTKTEITFILLLVSRVPSLTISDNTEWLHYAALNISIAIPCFNMYFSVISGKEGKEDVSGTYINVTHLITLPLHTVPFQFLGGYDRVQTSFIQAMISI